MAHKPLKQGDLDGLCSIYACFNAIRWINGPNFMSATEDYDGACAIFSIPFRANIATMDTVLNGADVDVVVNTLKIMKDRYPTFAYRQLKRKENILKLIDKGPVIIGFSGMDNHWTVITHYDEKYFYLYDSSGYTKFKIEDVLFNPKTIDENKICISYRDVVSLYSKIKA